MQDIRVREVADGEELVLAEELLEARIALGQVDPRAGSLERRHKALSEVPQPSIRSVAAAPRRLRAKVHDWIA